MIDGSFTILILFTAMLFIIAVVAMCRWRPALAIGVLLLGGLTFLFLGWLFLGHHRAPSHPPLRDATVQQATVHPPRQQVQPNAPTAAETLEEVYEQLTQPRIVLEGESEQAAIPDGSPPADDPEPEAVAAAEETERQTHSDAPNEASAEPVAEDSDAPADGVQEATANPPRPDWVVNPPKRVGWVQKAVVQSSPQFTPDDAYADLRHRMESEVRDHLRKLAARDLKTGTLVPPLVRLDISPAYIEREVCRDEFVETVETRVGPMQTAYVLMEFDGSVDDELLQRLQAYQQQVRLAEVGVGAGGIVGLLALVFGLLKIDTWTKGYYTKRLFIGVPLGIAALLSGLLMLS